MMFKRLVVILAMAALLHSAVIAQAPAAPDQKSNPSTPQQQKEQRDLERQTVAFLEEMIGDAMSLKLIENRIFVLTSAANLLWKRDEARARELLREAMNQYYSMGQPDWQDKSGFFDNYISIRTYLLQLLAGRDAKLALEFLRATRNQIPKGNGRLNGTVPDYDEQLELQLAVRMAENDPQLALQIAEETLNKGLNQQVLEIWSSLQKKDARMASRLSGQIITKLKSADLLKGYGESNIAFTMISDLRTRIREAQKDDKASSPAAVQSLAEMQQIYRELLDVMVAAVLKLTTANLLNVQEQTLARNLLERTHSLLPDIEKNLPSRVAAVRAKLSQFNNAFYQPAFTQESYEAIQNKTVDELVELAAKSKPEMREFLYRAALNKAVADGDAERAKQIAKDQFGETISLEPVLQQMEEQKIKRAAEQGKFDEARQSLSSLKEDDEKARAIIAMAKQAEAKRDSKLQRELLDEAYGLLAQQMETRQQVTDQLLLATTYLSVNSDRSFEILESATDKLNSVMSAIILIDSFDQGGRFKDGEMRMAGADFASGIIDNLDEQIAAFARKDFGRTTSALKRWQITEVRLMIGLAMAETILGDRKDGRTDLSLQ